jgi:predicted NAD-dependent protein-ADP-ribosyltransferase YbiA (DUF1768 family)
MTEIVFSTLNDDGKVRFLSNKSKYSFILKNKKWPTVEHYFQAMKFEGTEFEEEIRHAETVFQAQKLATTGKYVWDVDPRTEKKVKVRGYGKGYQYRIRDNFKRLEKKILEEAIRAKFSQKKLENIRWELSVKDLEFSELSGDCQKIVHILLYLSYKVMKMEGWNKIFHEMIEDSIYIFTSKQIGGDIMNIYADYEKKRKIKPMANYTKILEEIRKYIVSKKYPVELEKKTLSLFASVLAWYTIIATGKEKDIMFDQLTVFRGIQVNLRPGKRWYRDQIPPNLQKYKKKRRKPKV